MIREADLEFVLKWASPHARGTAAEATRGSLVVRLGAKLLWGHRGAGIPWTWVDLLEHLTTAWVPLLVEEADPISLDVPPAHLWHAAQERWNTYQDYDKRDREERALLRFDRNHDLAQALAGASPPRIFLLRQGSTMLVAADGSFTARPSFSDVMTKLEELGDIIAGRLSSLSDERATSALAGWNARARVSEERFITLSTGIERDRVIEISKAVGVDDPWGLERLSPSLVPEATIERHHDSTTPQLCAARMLGPAAPVDVVSRVLTWIAGLSPTKTPALDEYGPRAIRELGSLITDRRAWVQGQRLASWARIKPGFAIADRVDPATLLQRLGVQIHEQDLGWDGVDAVACWGANKGPAILVNTAGRHAQGEEGRRSTLAHELCHLLIDRQETLPMAEVLGGRAPSSTEARASAFAAQLLLPLNVAGEALSNAKTRTDAQKVVRQLKQRYGASSQVVAWQAVRSDYRLKPPVLGWLQTLVPKLDLQSFLGSAEKARVR